MRKTFQLTHPKIKVPRLLDAAKSDIRKYMKRERGKPLPEGADFWDFDCKCGPTAETAESVHPAELNKRMDEAEKQQLTSFYIEVMAKPGHRTKKP